MTNIKDVIVIGSGFAGVTAAKAAVEEGLSVAVITKGEGATILGSGAIDVLGVIPTKEANYSVVNIQNGINSLVENEPKHPYAVLKDIIDDGIKAFQEVCRLGGMQYTGDGVENKMVANTLGTFKGTAYLPYTSKDSVVTDFQGKVLVVGFAGHSDFNAEYAAKSFNSFGKKYVPNSNAQYIATKVELPSFAGRTKLTNAELGAKPDTNEGISELGDELRRMTSTVSGLKLILLPPVLGYQNYQTNKDYLESVTGVKISELLTGGHSIAGQRLVDAMKNGLEKLGVDVNNCCNATSIEEENGVYTVKYRKNGLNKEMQAKAIVLATGSFIGGGITAYREDLTAAVINEPLGRVSADMVNIKVFTAGGHGYTKIGVKTYKDLRLAQGKLSGAIHVCGEIMESYDWVYERSGGGVAVASGYLAGKNAAANVKGGIA